jgi:hypothetical protein
MSCGGRRSDEKCAQILARNSERQKGRDYFEDIGINMGIILKLVSDWFGGSVLADRALVVLIMNFRVP